MKSNKHLSIVDRRTIENLLNQNCSFSEISNVIKKHRTTISREVYNHRIMKEPRLSLNEKTPFEVFCFLDNPELLSLLNISQIPKDEVNLTKNIFK